jgi:uncharacterized protein (TIGR00730 family)
VQSGQRSSMEGGAEMRRICVFCGSSPGAKPAYRAAAESLGSLLARRGIGLVFGGGSVGLMGVLADAVLGAGGEVIGVIPHALEAREVAHKGLADLRVVGSMHERKALMADLADGFIALPGGIGTLEEMFEILTWAQLGIHAKPCALLDVANYFEPLLHFLDRVVEQRFLRPEHRGQLLVDTDAERLLSAMGRYRSPQQEKWLDRGER